MAFAMTVNVQVQMQIKYVDVYANDTTKNAGKGYGSQVAVKGTINGSTETIYLKGFTDANLSQLQSAGVIASGSYDADPAQKYNIPVSGKSAVTLVLNQPAGQKYPKLAITGDTPTPAPTSNGTPKSTAPVASALSQNEHNVGWLPGDEVETGAPPATNGKLGALRTTHARCFREVIENYVPVAAKAGLEISLEGASALTFQLYKMETDLR
jgi:hypothetical protein